MSLDFNGTTDYVVIPDAPKYSFGSGTTDTRFTVSAWVNMDDATKFRMICKRASLNKEWMFTTDATDLLRFDVIDDSAGVQQYVSSVALTSYEGTWIHVAGTYDGRGGASASDGLEVYINGANATNARGNTGAGYVAMEPLAANVEIGRLGDVGDFANGKMTDVGLYDRILTPNEIRTLAKRPNIAYELKRRRVYSAATGNRRRRLLIGT